MRYSAQQLVESDVEYIGYADDFTVPGHHIAGTHSPSQCISFTAHKFRKWLRLLVNRQTYKI